MAATGKPETVIRGIPERGFRQHWTRNLLFSDRENRLYLTIGSKENAAVEEPLRGTIVAYALDASGTPVGEPQIVARCLFADFGHMQEALEKRGITPLSAAHEFICTAPVELPEAKANEALAMIDPSLTSRLVAAPGDASSSIRP